jgi:DNA-directed RNA polymerase, alpha subunit
MNFEKPDYKITEYVENKNYGKFELEPLERGFGTTIGNALRRVMLSSMPGSAVTSVKIDGVLHEFQKIDGVREDVMNIILNIKTLVVKNHSTDKKVIRLSANKEGAVTAGEIEHDADIEIVNPDLVICNLVKGGKIDIEMTVNNGRGYVDAKENKKIIGDVVGVIPIDSIYSPVENVAFEVESARVGHNENYDKLIMSVYTNGSITPEECMALASRILIEHLNIITDLNHIADITGIIAEKKVDTITKTLETPIEEIEFSVRAYNCLKRANIHTMQDLIDKKEVEVTKIRNLGKKSLKEVIDKVNEMGLKFKD